MKYKVAICDDEDEQREYLQDIVITWARKNCHLVEMKQYVKAEDFLFDYAIFSYDEYIAGRIAARTKPTIPPMKMMIIGSMKVTSFARAVSASSS